MPNRTRLTGRAVPLLNGWQLWSFYANNILKPMDYPNDFKEFMRLLNEKNVDYLVVGGYAVAQQDDLGHP